MLTIGERIDRLMQLKQKKKIAQQIVEEIEQEIAGEEEQLIELMDAQGVQRSTGSMATVSIVESIKPSVQDWDQFYDYIKRHDYFHLLDRRPSVNGCRELFEKNGRIPGVVPFTKRTVRTTSL